MMNIMSNQDHRIDRMVSLVKNEAKDAAQQIKDKTEA